MGISVVTLRECDERAVLALLELLDQEFLRSKARSGTIAKRYPNLFTEQNADNLYLAWSGNELAGTVVVKRFDWLANQQTWKGAMLGLVCVAPHFRGRGVGTDLVQHVVQRLARQAVDFAVLWTTIPSFYARLGWRASDRGMFGTLRRIATTSDHVSPSADCDWYTLENIRAKWLESRVLRTSVDYETVPTVVRNVRRVIVSASDEETAYALVGDAETTGIVYELVGHPAVFGRLWDFISAPYLEICVNDFRDSVSYEWFRNNIGMDWSIQLQTMWLGLSTAMDSAQLTGWHISYFDRI